MTAWINYHHLLYFKVIAEEQSVSKAAEKLRLGQPTLSAQLKKFEDTLGVELFQRQHKKLILTEQGKIALEYARQIFKLGDEMYEVLNDRIVPSRTHIQIGALDSVSKQVTLQLTKAAYKAGKCQVSVIEGKSDEMIRELTAHKIDLFVTNYIPTSGDSKNLIHKTVSRKPVYLYGSSKFNKLKKDFPQSLSGQMIVMPTYDSKLRYDLEHWSKVHQINLDIVSETQDTDLQKLMAIEGLGLIPATRLTVSQQIQSKELCEIGKVEGIHEELFLVSAPRKRVNPIAEDLMNNFLL